jgi:hypothetical protein
VVVLPLEPVVLAGQLLSTTSTRVTVKSVVLALVPEADEPVPMELEPLTSDPLEVEPPLGFEVPLCAVFEEVPVLVDAEDPEPAVDPEDELGVVPEALPLTPPPPVLPLALMPVDPEPGVP